MKFSVAIPAYKPDFLKQAIQSVLAQSCGDFELVVVDDASPFDLSSIVGPFLTDSRVRFYRNVSNCGAENVVDNWNVCLGYCSGEYLICMGDDDMLLPGCLQDLNETMSKFPGLGVYHIQTCIVDGGGQIIEKLPQRPGFEYSLDLLLHRWNGREQFIGDFCFNLNLLKRNGGFYKLPYAWGSDDISSYMAACGDGARIPDGIANTGRPGFLYRRSGLTISSGGRAEDKLRAMMLCGDWFRSELDSRTSSTGRELAGLEEMRRLCRRHFKDVSRDYVKKDIGRNPGRLAFWLGNKELCRLSSADIVYQASKGRILNALNKLGRI